MPIYEYHCTSCDDHFEISQKITDAPLSNCPKCSGALEKLISQTSFVLKGSGWYQTDYGRKGSSGAKKDSGPACAASGSKSSCAGCPSGGD